MHAEYLFSIFFPSVVIGWLPDMKDFTPNILVLSREIFGHTLLFLKTYGNRSNLLILLFNIVTSHLDNLVTPRVTPLALRCDQQIY